MINYQFTVSCRPKNANPADFTDRIINAIRRFYPTSGVIVGGIYNRIEENHKETAVFANGTIDKQMTIKLQQLCDSVDF